MMEVGHQKPDLKNKIFQKKIEINIRVMFQCFGITAKNKIANTTLKSELSWEFLVRDQHSRNFSWCELLLSGRAKQKVSEKANILAFG